MADKSNRTAISRVESLRLEQERARNEIDYYTQLIPEIEAEIQKILRTERAENLMEEK